MKARYYCWGRGRGKRAGKPGFNTDFRDRSLVDSLVRCHYPSETQFDTLGFTPSIFRVLAMARLSRFYGAVAGRGNHLSSLVPITSLAGSRDRFLV